MRRQTGAIKSVICLLALVSVILGASLVASAYTIVMRGGRRIQIPAQFTVTQTTLTYEVAATIGVTLQLAAIDVPATERVNNEAPGSLLKRAVPSSVERSPSATVGKSAPARTITNKELEPYARLRKESEAAYEKRRIELGLPALAESQRKASADAALLAELAVAQETDEQRSEQYWKGRAGELRIEIAATDREIDLVEAELLSMPAPAPLFGFSGFPPYVGGHGPGRRRFGFERDRIILGNRGFLPQRPRVFVAPNSRVGFDSGAHLNKGQVLIGHGSSRQGLRGGPLLLTEVEPFGGLFQHFPYWSRGTALEDLIVYRADLAARLRELEDEARRADVPPGWLR